MYRNRKAYAYTTQREIRRAFWEQFPNLSRRKIGPPEHRSYTTDTRCAFVDFIDGLHRDGQISDALAQRTTLQTL